VHGGVGVRTTTPVQKKTNTISANKIERRRSWIQAYVFSGSLHVLVIEWRLIFKEGSNKGAL